MVILRKMVKI